MFTQEQTAVSLRATQLLEPVLRATVIMDQEQLNAVNPSNLRPMFTQEQIAVSLRATQLLELVFKSPVRSGLLPLRGIDRDRDQSTIIRDRQKTGPDRKKPRSVVFCGLLTGLRS